MAQEAGFATVMSHRSGETEDTFISDLAVGIGADYLKAGSPRKPERAAKYRRLKEIIHHLQNEQRQDPGTLPADQVES